MTAADLRTWQAEHAADHDRMAGLVAALGIAFATLGGTALFFGLTL